MSLGNAPTSLSLRFCGGGLSSSVPRPLPRQACVTVVRSHPDSSLAPPSSQLLCCSEAVAAHTMKFMCFGSISGSALLTLWLCPPHSGRRGQAGGCRCMVCLGLLCLPQGEQAALLPARPAPSSTTPRLPLTLQHRAPVSQLLSSWPRRLPETPPSLWLPCTLRGLGCGHLGAALNHEGG